MTELEQFVIEAAIEWAFMREASHYGPVCEAVMCAERSLEKAVSALHSEHDGRWRVPAPAIARQSGVVRDTMEMAKLADALLSKLAPPAEGGE